ncbi:MAG: ABC transporter permease [Leucobacter sp.]|nr:ABC transporter permease [Leucobacter sp.]
MVRRIAILLGLGLLTLFAISVIVFGATQALPGDITVQLLGVQTTPEAVAQLREQLGLDRPVIEQYFTWISGVLQGDFGTSLANQLPVATLMSSRLINTLVLAGISLLITVPVAILVGTIAARYRDSWFDRGLVAVTTIISGIPEFVIGILLVSVVIFFKFTAIPPVSTLDPGKSIWEQGNMLVLPVITLVLTAVPLLARMVRSTVVEQLDAEYIVMGRLNGLPTRNLVLQQALPNAFPPLIQSVALVTRYLVAGVVMVEVVFGFPGMGTALIDSVALRDLPTVQFVALALAAVIVAANILADLFATLATPKLRTALS